MEHFGDVVQFQKLWLFLYHECIYPETTTPWECTLFCVSHWTMNQKSLRPWKSLHSPIKSLWTLANPASAHPGLDVLYLSTCKGMNIILKVSYFNRIPGTQWACGVHVSSLCFHQKRDQYSTVLRCYRHYRKGRGCTMLEWEWEMRGFYQWLRSWKQKMSRGHLIWGKSCGRKYCDSKSHILHSCFHYEDRDTNKFPQ